MNRDMPINEMPIDPKTKAVIDKVQSKTNNDNKQRDIEVGIVKEGVSPLLTEIASMKEYLSESQIKQVFEMVTKICTLVTNLNVMSEKINTELSSNFESINNYIKELDANKRISNLENKVYNEIPETFCKSNQNIDSIKTEYKKSDADLLETIDTKYKDVIKATNHKLLTSERTQNKVLVDISKYLSNIYSSLETEQKARTQKEFEYTKLSEESDNLKKEYEDKIKSIEVKYKNQLEEKNTVIERLTQKSETVDRDLRDVMDIIGNIYEFYNGYRYNNKLARLNVDLDNIYSFASSCKTEIQLSDIYKKVEQIIGTKQANGEWNIIIDGFINVYNQNNGTSLKRQDIKLNNDRYNRNMHSSIDYSNEGDLITEVILQGIVNSITGDLFRDCRSRIATKSVVENFENNIVQSNIINSDNQISSPRKRKWN